MIDMEKLLEWDPDFLFVDQGGQASVEEDYRKSRNGNSLSAVKKGQVYSQLPYNFYSTNLDTAIADAYFLGQDSRPRGLCGR